MKQIYYMRLASDSTIVKASDWAGGFGDEGFSNLDILKHLFKFNERPLFDVNGTEVKFEMKSL